MLRHDGKLSREMMMRRPKTEAWERYEKKRQRKKRNLQREGRGVRELLWRMHLEAADPKSQICC